MHVYVRVCECVCETIHVHLCVLHFHTFTNVHVHVQWNIVRHFRAPVLVAIALIENGMKYHDAVDTIRR